ncbi:hypothetical protein [Scytonema sp. NUACC26]|uniref:hypothetical protein n=1 Tax=Scytonema sp. NUACC26 TaxID=3140176 RepID=UPI0034DC75CB
MGVLKDWLIRAVAAALDNDVMIDGYAYLRICKEGERIIIHSPLPDSVTVTLRYYFGKPQEIHYTFTETILNEKGKETEIEYQ